MVGAMRYVRYTNQRKPTKYPVSIWYFLDSLWYSKSILNQVQEKKSEVSEGRNFCSSAQRILHLWKKLQSNLCAQSLTWNIGRLLIIAEATYVRRRFDKKVNDSV